MGTGGPFPGCKVAGHEADHSPPSSAEVKECTLPIRLYGMVLKLSTGTTSPLFYLIAEIMYLQMGEAL